MRNKMYSILCGVAVSVASLSNVNAAPIAITYDQVGVLSEATFGGSGIANDQVAITRYVEELCTGQRCRPSGTEITLGLSAHGRYENLLEGTDGAGTYFASAGTNTPPSSSSAGATWNFDYFVDIENGDFADYEFKLFYDFDATTGNDISTHGVLNLNALESFFSQSSLDDITRAQGSQNLLFNFLGTDTPGFIDAPSTSFDPNALGEYTFALAAFRDDFEVARSAIRVVVEEVPEPSALALIGFGLLAMGRRFYKKS